VRALDAERGRELPHDAVLEVEHLVEPPVHLRVRHRLARRRVDNARRDPQAVAHALVAADDHQRHAEIAGDRRGRPVGATRRLRRSIAIDDAQDAENR